MKKTTRKLALKSQTIVVLQAADLAQVVGGTLPAIPGFIMKDSVIVRTSGR